MRLTVTHLRRAPQFTNALLQREIDFRGLGISSMDENALVLLGDEFDVVNLTSNAFTALEYFPTSSGGKSTAMARVTTLVAHRNHIQKVSIASCVLALPNVVHFLADRNSLTNVRDLLFLKHWTGLEVLSLEGNPVFDAPPDGFDVAKLRAFLIFLCPGLRLLNYNRIRQTERDLAESLKRDFKTLVAGWEGTASVVSADGRKMRKRGRENRALGPAATGEPAEIASAMAAIAESTETQPANGDANGGSASATPRDDDGGMQARLNQLEERILSDDITSEEIVALEQEMNELTAELDRRKKRRI